MRNYMDTYSLHLTNYTLTINYFFFFIFNDFTMYKATIKFCVWLDLFFFDTSVISP